MSDSEQMDRRRILKEMTVAALGAAVGSLPAAYGQDAAGTSKFFPAGFKTFKFQTSGTLINGVIGGQGPPLLLLHGAPQSHISWRIVAPKLINEYTVVVTDLRGYGDSGKPLDGENHSNYSKRAMALDQVEVMKHFGFDRFPVAGHDRGGRVAQRMALDHPDKVTKLAVLDIIPTYYLYTHVTIEFVQAYFHWFNNIRQAPAPENDIKATFNRPVPTDPVQAEYFRVSSDPAAIHGMCEDYRAGASIDLKHDEADLNHKITCPLLVLWGERSPMGRIYDVLPIWMERGTKVTGKGLPGGHNLQEEVPDQVFAELRAFLRA
jgi:haloacetate dehalogenase